MENQLTELVLVDDAFTFPVDLFKKTVEGRQETDVLIELMVQNGLLKFGNIDQTAFRRPLFPRVFDLLRSGATLPGR